ncbi:MAG: cupin domain-containing protein [Acidimicrobiales bacterium]
MTTKKGFFNHVESVQPKAVSAEDGWHQVDIRFLLPESLELASPLAPFRATFPPGAEHRTHTHPDADEFVYVISGRCALGAGDEEREGGAGSVQLIPAGVVHWLRNLDPESPVEVVGGYLGVRSLEKAGYLYVPGHALPGQAASGG